jgi:hypothetical protein
MKNFFFHLTLYYLAWFSGLYSAANNHYLMATLILMIATIAQMSWQKYVTKRSNGMLLMVGLFGLQGIITDAIMLNANLIVFSANPFGPYLPAPWMIGIWLDFGITFYALLYNYFKRYGIISLLSLIFFPLAYLAGGKIGAASFPNAATIHCIWVGVISSMLMPLTLFIYNQFEVKNA